MGRQRTTWLNYKLPQHFIPFLLQKGAHFLAQKIKGFIKFVPDDFLFEPLQPNPSGPLWGCNEETKFFYLGKTTITEAGLLAIPKDVREFAAITGKEVVIAGLLEVMEVWNKKAWDKAMEETTDGLT